MKTPRIVSEFRAGLGQGELLIQNCNSCGKPNMWPRYACPHCQSDDLGWAKSSGKGTLHSFCVLRQGAPEGFDGDLPYAIGVVKLDEGVQLLARLEASAPDDWSAYSCDDRVEFVAPGAAEAQRRPCAIFRRAAD
ncbi:Zn-ribbon domain-containing OB-fold protein [Novosphingobium lentum]|uniref:Zn-ribbon domain-containing OB-fold protein n=1 Tax=Novosphingobium lentum TaxID=145287 RepID=UPI0008316AD8|nr:OB-fold domain-containing protein [Novosphingobium lentum]